ncbi:MAG: GNAT family N-acetyltransferase [Caldilineaceae bacterium]
MSVEVATRAQLPAIERLLRMGKLVSSGLALEDLPAVIDRGLVLLAGEHNYPWGVMAIDPEVRPATLPADAADRAQVRAVALRHGPWLSTAGLELGVGLAAIVESRGRPLDLTAYASDRWLQRLLEQAGFAREDVVIFLQRLELTAHPSHSPQPPAGITLRAAELADVPAIAAFDAETFAPLWHFGRAEIMELLLRGRVQVAVAQIDSRAAQPWDGEQVIAYSALLPSKHDESHLARLAVHPAWQGKGIGRLLLADAMNAAAADGSRSLALNTQQSNLRSRHVYAAAGFVETPLALPIYLRRLRPPPPTQIQ